MTIKEATQLLQSIGFTAITGTMSIAFSNNYLIAEPILGVIVSEQHRCFEKDCAGVHIIGTETALKYMSVYALRKLIYDNLKGDG